MLRKEGLMKIHFDNIIYSLQRAGGISTYWTALITRLLRDQVDISFTEMPNQNISRAEFIIPPDKILKTDAGNILVNRFKSLSLPQQAKPFIFHSSYNRITTNLHAKQVITIHDFVHEKFYRGLRRYLHLYQKNKAIGGAEKIIAVSQNTKQDLLQFHPYLKEENIAVVYNGVSEDFFSLNNKKKENARPYLIFIGSRAYYKNFNFAIDLVAELSAFDLYIVGAGLSKSEGQLLQKKLKGRWKIFTHIENDALNSIYNHAYALIYPSSYEGFGIPLLEVMKTGTPFVALNKSSIPEVAGKAGLLVNELDIDAFKQAILSIDGKENELSTVGKEQAAKFSWERCYKETLGVYKDLE